MLKQIYETAKGCVHAVPLKNCESINAVRWPAEYWFQMAVSSHEYLARVCHSSKVLIQYVRNMARQLEGLVVAIDGKTVRGSKAGGETPLHLISAYCDDLRLVLGQRASAHKKNEIKDIPGLLVFLTLEARL